MAFERARLSPAFSLGDVHAAERRLARMTRLLISLFPQLERSRGVIESPLLPARSLQGAMMGAHSSGKWLIKADHTLAVAGSIKARGGFYEVLVHAEALALRYGILKPQQDPVILASSGARALFSRHRVIVGSTGNLGLSIGMMAAALGFKASIYMSSDAKEWKKERLRACGAEVIESRGDFGAAVAAARAQSGRDPNSYFVDDENSERLFLGYSVAALRLRSQLSEIGIEVGPRHPLFVYIPCGVGGAPTGIAFGLRCVYGNDVHCFFAEPVASPSMLARLASPPDQPISVRDIGLDNSTEADGLAVARASELAASIARPMVSGVFTVPDDDLFEDLYRLERTEGLRIEPSAAAGFRGPRHVLSSHAGRDYLTLNDCIQNMNEATHVLWTTGGALIPKEEYSKFHHRGRMAAETADSWRHADD